ncbi:MAG: YraN family protein [Candidatus Eremiobacteraeota bacterium]|nr:YraN family protein [Candidatus Eremiobacteraeota bacterium]
MPTGTAPSALGKSAEDAAARYLIALGMQLLARNVRGRGGEIDIVAKDGETVVFIEVKARSNHRFGSAIASVDARKKRRIRAIAEDYLQIVAPDARARFDVLTVEGQRVTLHRNAFR